MRNTVLLVVLMALLAACQVVPSTGDSAQDAAAAQRFLPTIPNYTAVEANNIADALGKVGVGASVLTGNVALAGAIAKIDDVIRCYQGVGAVSARIYTETRATSEVPKIGALAVINTTRLQRNLLSCVLNTGVGAQAQAQSVGIEPCGGSGSFTISGESLQYVFAATAPELCSAFQAAMPRQ